jgi:hypothetical protein
MKYTGVVQGLVSNPSKLTEPPLRMARIQVNYTSDNIGKTLSLGSLDDDIQISIPFDELIKILK